MCCKGITLGGSDPNLFALVAFLFNTHVEGRRFVRLSHTLYRYSANADFSPMLTDLCSDILAKTVTRLRYSWCKRCRAEEAEMEMSTRPPVRAAMVVVLHRGSLQPARRSSRGFCRLTSSLGNLPHGRDCSSHLQWEKAHGLLGRRHRLKCAKFNNKQTFSH